VEFVWFALAVAVCIGLGWWATKIDPHWVSKDGRRFICAAQRLSDRGDPQTRWRETRVIVTGREVQIDQKRFMRRTTSFWRVASRSDDPPRRKEIFLLSGYDDAGAPAMLALRVPRKSRAVAALQSAMPATR
jgi:hypothetical protein